MSTFLCSHVAAAVPLVSLAIDPCVEVAQDEVRRLSAIELGGLLARSGEAGATRVVVDCEADRLRLTVDDSITGKTSTRLIELADAPQPTRARLLALAIAELVQASWLEIEANPRPAVPAAGATAPAGARRAAAAAVGQVGARSLRLHAAGGVMAFFGESALVGGGGGLRLISSHPRRFGWMIDVRADHAAVTTSLGQVTSDTLSVGTAIGFHAGWRHAALLVGAGVRGGAARLSGASDLARGRTGRTHWGAWGGPLATMSVEVWPARRILLGVAVEVGYALLSVGGLVGGRREVAVDGLWLGLQAGIGVSL